MTHGPYAPARMRRRRDGKRVMLLQLRMSQRLVWKGAAPEDRWSGELQRYQRPGGALFAPFADTASFEVCSTGAPACGHGSTADILASPRPDSSAVELAL